MYALVISQGLSVLAPNVSGSQHMYDADITFDLQGDSGASQAFSLGLILVMGSNSGEPRFCFEHNLLEGFCHNSPWKDPGPCADREWQVKRVHAP